MDQASQEVMSAYLNQNGFAQQKGLIATFYEDSVLDERATNGWSETKYHSETGEPYLAKHMGAGRPIYKDVLHVEIRAAGDKDEIRRRIARESDKQRFPREFELYERTRAGGPEGVIGTPLDKLPFLTKSQCMEFRAIGVRNAEDLADMSDANGQKFMDFQRIRQRCKDFLALAAGQAPTDALREEARLRDEQAKAMQEQIKSLEEKLELALARKK